MLTSRGNAIVFYLYNALIGKKDLEDLVNRAALQGKCWTPNEGISLGRNVFIPLAALQTWRLFLEAHRGPTTVLDFLFICHPTYIDPTQCFEWIQHLCVCVFVCLFDPFQLAHTSDPHMVYIWYKHVHAFFANSLLPPSFRLTFTQHTVLLLLYPTHTHTHEHTHTLCLHLCHVWHCQESQVKLIVSVCVGLRPTSTFSPTLVDYCLNNTSTPRECQTAWEGRASTSAG